MNASTSNDRRVAAMEAALTLYLRYGYRKTSMDDISRETGLSRQGLYLHFPNKKALFVATIEHLLETMGQGIAQALGNRKSGNSERLLQAFDVYVGAAVEIGLNVTAVDELMTTARGFLGDRVDRFDESFRQEISKLLADYASPGLDARTLADLLCAVSTGLKYQNHSRDEYLTAMARAIKLVTRSSPAG